MRDSIWAVQNDQHWDVFVTNETLLWAKTRRVKRAKYKVKQCMNQIEMSLSLIALLLPIFRVVILLRYFKTVCRVEGDMGHSWYGIGRGEAHDGQMGCVR